MSNTWPFAQPASPSAPVIDGSFGLPHSWHPPSPGSARKTARSARGRPSTCHYREENHQEQLSWGPLVTQWEVRNEEGWSVSAVAFQSAAASSARCWEVGNSVLTPPPHPPPCHLWELGVGGDAVTYSALLCDNSRQGALGEIWAASE